MTDNEPACTYPWTLGTCSYSEYHPDMGASVRISLGLPRGATHVTVPDCSIHELTPRGWYLNKAADEYLKHFREQLDRYGVEEIGDIFEKLTGFVSGRPLILLCFERLNRNPECHRRDFADWWEEKTGEIIPELGAKPSTKRRTPQQDVLPLFGED